MPYIIPKHPLLIRITHWINFPVLMIMIWSGFLIYWAYDPYQIRLGDTILVKFFPEWFYKKLDLEFSLATGMAYHFAFAWLFTITGLIYVTYIFFSGEWRVLLPNRHTPKEAWHTLLHDLRLRKTPPPPGKFNGAQRLAYTGIIVMGAGSVFTGLAILKPTQLAWLTDLLGGYQTARTIHFALTIGYLLFFVIHIAQVMRAGWNNFRAMIAGYEVSSNPESTSHVHTEQRQQEQQPASPPSNAPTAG